VRFVKDSPVRARPFRRQQTVVPARTRVKLLCGLAVPGNHPTSFVDRHRRHTLFSFAVVNHRFMGNSLSLMPPNGRVQPRCEAQRSAVGWMHGLCRF